MAIPIITLIGIYLAYRNSQLVRFYLRIFFFYFNILISAILCCFVTPFTYRHNMGCTAPMTLLRFFASFWLNIEVEVRGAEKIDIASGPEKKPLVLISNHQSALDLYVISNFWPEKCTALMKDSLRKIPFFNFAATKSNAIWVSRFDPQKARGAIDEAIKAMKDKALKVWVFPEGTRNRSNGILPFKKGAFNIAIQANFPIIPVVISSYSSFYSRERHYFHSKGKVIVQVMDSISTDEISSDAVPELTETIRNEMLSVYEKISAEVVSGNKKAE